MKIFAYIALIGATEALRLHQKSVSKDLTKNKYNEDSLMPGGEEAFRKEEEMWDNLSQTDSTSLGAAKNSPSPYG